MKDRPYNRNFLSLDKEEGVVRLSPRPDGLWMATLNVSNRPAAGKNGASGGGRRRPRRTLKGRQVDPQALEEVRALLVDRSRRRDLLIEHLHLIQDKYGHLSAAHLAALARGNEARAHRGLRGRDLLRAFRRGEGGRDAAARHRRARVRFAFLRHGRSGEIARGTAEKTRPGRARGARAVHGRLRPRAGLRRRPRAGARRHRQFGGDCGEIRRACARLQDAHRFRRLPEGRRLQTSPGLPRGQAHARGDYRHRERCGAARPRRRRVSHRAQVVARARRARAAHDGGERRRGRARHVQGPASISSAIRTAFSKAC